MVPVEEYNYSWKTIVFHFVVMGLICYGGVFLYGAGFERGLKAVNDESYYEGYTAAVFTCKREKRKLFDDYKLKLQSYDQKIQELNDQINGNRIYCGKVLNDFTKKKCPEIFAQISAETLKCE